MKIHKKDMRNVEYINLAKESLSPTSKLFLLATRVVFKLGFCKEFKSLNQTQRLKIFLIWSRIRGMKVDEVIGVDFLSLWIAQVVFGKSHLLSLEISKNDLFYKISDRQKIQSVIIQSEERYTYLFENVNIPKFIVQNAPVYQAITEIPTRREGLVFCGSSCPGFGLKECLDFINKYPEFTLTIRGAISPGALKKIRNNFGHLLEKKIIIVDDTYIEPEQLVDYLKKFYIGFCFYDLEVLKKDTRVDIFNFIAVPSGKLFNYYNAGVPVIGSNIFGLQSVVDFETGVLIDDLSPESIRKAIDDISTDHERVSANCLKAARYYSFDRALAPFRDFLAGDPS